METRSTPDGAVRDPALSTTDREELGHLAFLAREIDSLHERGLISAETHATILAETRLRIEGISSRARARALLAQARGKMATARDKALTLAEQARQADPNLREAWDLLLGLRIRERQVEAATALCSEAAVRFADFPSAAEVILRIEKQGATPPLDLVRQAREALDRGDDARVIELCRSALASQPDHIDATVNLAFALQRLERLDEALPLYRRLAAALPDVPAWRSWVANIERRLAEKKGVQKYPMADPGPILAPIEKPEPIHELPVSPPAHRPAPIPSISWKEVAGEFLQDHWQKLILCLAVLLIVVSSNVGAYQLLGPKLWSPIGKCVLALIYTSMFAALGVGLVKWGAERAGRIMLLTTLVVIPANFMLAGQMRLLTEPTAGRLAVLAFDAVAIFLLIRLVVSSLHVPRGALVLSISLFAISAFNAAASPGSPWPMARQYAVFIAPVIVMQFSELWLTRRLLPTDRIALRETCYFALGLLGFTFLTGLVRSGVFVLGIHATLYAFPLMLLAAACVHAAGQLLMDSPDPRTETWLRFGGLTVSGIAFALAVARPHGAIYSGSTLATALVGLSLYAGSLRWTRHPAYIYFAFGALFVAYFGVYDFAKDLIQSVEAAASEVLGYGRHLPAPFKAINGLVFSPILGALALYFRRSWGDARLSRHCHYLGVPFAIGACLFSTLEPTAAVICLTGYALLFSVAAPVFSTPRLLYLATASASGALYFGSTLRTGTTLGEQAFLLSLLGLAFWAVSAAIKRFGVNDRYRTPLLHSTIALAAISALGVALSVPAMPPVTFAQAAALTLASLAVLLVTVERPIRWLAFAATAGVSLTVPLVAEWAAERMGSRLGLLDFACVAALTALVGAALAAGLRRSERMHSFSTVFPAPLEHVSFLIIGAALFICGLHAVRAEIILSVPDYARGALAFGLLTGALAFLTRPYPFQAVAHLTVACGLGMWVCLFQLILGGGSASAAGYAAVSSTYALLLLAIEEVARLRDQRALQQDQGTGRSRPHHLLRVDLLARTLPDFEVGVVFLAVVLGCYGFRNGLPLVATFVSGSLAMFWSTRMRPSSSLVNLGILLSIPAALCAAALAVGWSDRGFTVALLALVTATGATCYWAVASLTARRDPLSLYSGPSLQASSLLCWAVYPLALLATGVSQRVYALTAGALVLVALVLSLLTSTTRKCWPTYRAAFSLALAVLLVLVSLVAVSEASLWTVGLAALGTAAAFEVLGFVARWKKHFIADAEHLYARPLFVSALVLTLLGWGMGPKSTGTMVFVALAFLVQVKGLGGRGWIYPTIAALCAALYDEALWNWPPDRLAYAALGVAYGLWLLGLLARRAEPSLVRWLSLADHSYDAPVLHSAVAASLVALAMRVWLTVGAGESLSGSAGLFAGLAVFAVLMIKAYPDLRLIHGAIALGSLSAGLGAYPHFSSTLHWLPLGMGLASAALLGWRLLEPVEASICRRLSLPELSLSRPISDWSIGYFVLSLGVTATVVLLETLGIVLGTGGWPAAASSGPWLAIMVALALAASYLVAWPGRGVFGRTVVAHGVATLSIWWLAAPGSPLVSHFGIDGRIVLPLATAGLAALTCGLGLLARRPAWSNDLSRLGDDPLVWLDAYSAVAGLVLSLLAAVMTRAEVGWVTVATLMLAAAGPFLTAWARRWVTAGYAWSALLVAGLAFESLADVRPLLGGTEGDRAVAVAAGMMAAVFVIWLVSGRQRRAESNVATASPIDLPAPFVALAVEQVALVAAIAAGLAVAASTTVLDAPGRTGSSVGTGVLFGVAAFAVAMVARWGEGWLVYLAQTALLGAYFSYRRSFPLAASTDAIVLTLFGYANLGLAEAMNRFGLDRFARPTRHVALVAPLIPIALAAFDQSHADTRLFVLFATGTFYAIGCYMMEWKRLGYAAAVLYNALLWVLWSRFHWTVADHTAFFLVPVGMTAVLFAEVNRGSIGRSVNNAIRGVGLSTIYLSLVVPLWQYADLGTWTALLLLSLAGVFVGIGLRVQIFLWFGLAGFVLNVVYQLGRVGMEHSLAKWAIMLSLGIGLVFFVALNEKKRIVLTLKGYFDEARGWE